MPLIGTRKHPKGPNLKVAEPNNFVASGTKISFSSPQHNDSAHRPIAAYQDIFNLYDISLFKRYEEKNYVEPASLGLILKSWEFTGVPVLDGTGELGEMKLMVSMEYMPEFSSLFRPRRLECAIERCIYTAPEAYRLSGKCRLNWCVSTINSIDWVSYQSIGYAGYRKAEECYEMVWHTPITDQHLLTVRFDQVIRKKRTRLAEIYETIIERVMNSFEIKLSSDAKLQKENVRQHYPDETLSKTLPPYVFEEFELDNEYELIGDISAQHNFELPHEEVKKLWEAEKKRQRQMQKETRARVIESHLRFKLSEKEPQQR